MPLTNAQYAALKTAIQNDASVAALVAASNDAGIAAAYNQAAAFTVWRSDITVAEIRAAVTWSEIVALTVGQRETFALMLQSGVIDATKPNIRAGFAACLSGSSLTALTALAKRSATVFEKVFADTSGGNGAAATPAVATVEGLVSAADVSIALRNT